MATYPPRTKADTTPTTLDIEIIEAKDVLAAGTLVSGQTKHSLSLNNPPTSLL